MNIENCFNEKDFPFLARQIEEFRNIDKSFSVTNNTPLMLTAIVKLKPFLENNIKLYVGGNFDMYDKRVVAFLKENKIFVSFDKNDYAKGDIFLDCKGDLIDKGNPMAIVELTQTGSKKYAKQKLDIPVLSVDESKIKLLENYFGTADGFIRVFKKKVKATLKKKHFIVWGYGKIGKGIVHYLNRENAKITAVDVNVEDNITFAKKQNVEIIHPEEISKIKQLIKHAYCLVTCTGIHGLISKLPYASNMLTSNLILANMGAGDEFGDLFPKKRVLNNKIAANFLLDYPTELKYLDPVFYAHNLGFKLYCENKLETGFHEFPKALDNQIVQEWSKYWKEDISDIEGL